MYCRFRGSPQAQDLPSGHFRSNNAAFCVCLVKPTKRVGLRMWQLDHFQGLFPFTSWSFVTLVLDILLGPTLTALAILPAVITGVGKARVACESEEGKHKIPYPLTLVAPYRAILQYYRCDTPYQAILFEGGEHSPNMVRYPPLALSFTQAHQCDIPFCNISRDNCAITPPPQKKKQKSFAILSLHVSRDMKSIAPGPLSL